MISTLEKEITLRFLKARKNDGFLNVISIFSFIGISLGVAVLIVVMSVMNGFRTELINKIVGFNSHITVKSYENSINLDKLDNNNLKLISKQNILSNSGEAIVLKNNTSKGIILRGYLGSDFSKLEIIKNKNFKGNRSKLNKNSISVTLYDPLYTKNEIDTALLLLQSASIDESSCSCLELTKNNHCDAFDYFNPGIPKPSIYNLPRISKTKLRSFVADGRFDLDEIALQEVTEKQAYVLRSAHLKKPIIDYGIISDWFSRVEYPVYFLDYETYASAAPIIDGVRPHSPIPFQYSLHIKRSPDDDRLEHVEYLADEAVMPISLIEHMQKHIGDVGSIVSWHASFENTQNRNMAVMYPAKHDFLHGLIDRTVDLEDLFKEGYVDIKFQGSTSIKKVLPVLVPELDYAGMDVASGTDAMEAWQRLIGLPAGQTKDDLRKSMLEYCKLDTLAMVRIFEFMETFNQI